MPRRYKQDEEPPTYTIIRELKCVLDEVFIKFTGHACNDASCKLAILSLKHKCAAVVENEFNNLKHQLNASPELLSWNTVRFGGSFILDTITKDTLKIKDVRREAADDEFHRGRHSSRLDCCERLEAVAHLCSWCKVAHCDACLRWDGRGASHYNGYSWPYCKCGANYNSILSNRHAAYMVEIIAEDDVYVLQPVFPRACFRQKCHPKQLTVLYHPQAVRD